MGFVTSVFEWPDYWLFGHDNNEKLSNILPLW